MPIWNDLDRLQHIWDKSVSRRSFVRFLAATAGVLAFQGRGPRRALAKSTVALKPRKPRTVTTDCPLAIVTGESPAVITRRAVETLGGMSRFVQRGDVVVIKPNIGWDRTPAQAANTHPEVVAALVGLCRDSGAKIVKVFDHTCNDARRTYANSGIQEAVKKAGGQMSFISDWKFYPAAFPSGSLMAEWPLYRDAVECDCFINVPVAKHHGLTQVSLCMKNLMGVCGGRRGVMHQSIDRKLAELTAFIRPELNVVDATRMLLRHGPTGGNLADVRNSRTVIAGPDPVLADAYATSLFELDPKTIGHIRLGAETGLGTLNLETPGIRKVTV